MRLNCWRKCMTLNSLLFVIFTFSYIFLYQQSGELDSIKYHDPSDVELLPTKDADDRVFVLDAFLISDNEIKITTIRKCNSKKKLILHFGKNWSATARDIQDASIIKCPWFFAPRCLLVGYFGMITKIAKNDLIHVQASGGTVLIRSADNSALLRLIDSRIRKNSFQYKLAVCVQPIFLLADWTILIQFFETWIFHGATKFYVYFQSATPEAEELLRLYEMDRNVSVERIPWAPLPNGAGKAMTDQPNDYVYRGEVITSVNDCLLRSRAKAQYVVSSDLDEVLVTYNETLLSFVDRFLKKNPKAAALIFLQQYVAFQNLWANATDASAIDFGMLSNVSVERKVWKAGQRSKLVWIPEHVFKSHVHQVLEVRKGYKAMVVHPELGAVYHFRRIRSPAARDKDAYNSAHFAQFVPQYNAQWKERERNIKNLKEAAILQRKVWPNRGLKVMNAIDRCRDIMEKQKKQICTSYTRCLGNITDVRMEEWVFAEQRWSVL